MGMRQLHYFSTTESASLVFPHEQYDRGRILPCCSSNHRSPPPSVSLRLSKQKPLGLRIHRRPWKTFVGSEDSSVEQIQDDAVSPDDLEHIAQINRVLDLLRKNRDMMFGEVKLIMMIEDLRDVERKRLLGIDDEEVSRDDLVSALEEVHEGKIPENRVALRCLAEEMVQWPNLEVETKKSKPKKSLYAKATDTGIDPEVAAKKLNIDWDTAAEIDSEDENNEVEVPPVVGYSALYLLTGLPVIIGISVVLILFYNSLQ